MGPVGGPYGVARVVATALACIGPDGNLPLPWLAQPLQHALRTQKGHALLVHGAQGVGQFEFALSLAQSWLCSAPSGLLACGQCDSCHLVHSQTHPDLLVLLPELLQTTLGWGAFDSDSESASKAKPSKEIKTEAVRAAVRFSQTTTSRGGVKVVILHPAQRMNAVSANTLLKTLEEPPGAARFLLSCHSPDALPPTVRSRCQAVSMALPPSALAVQWLHERKVAQPEVMLAACAGQPLEALQWVQDGIDAAAWLRLPRQLQNKDCGALATWPLPRLLHASQKLCHDLLCVFYQAPPRYFSPACLPKSSQAHALCKWSQALTVAQRHCEHPWGMPLMVEALVEQAYRAIVPPISLTSAPAK
jgi:DNA polymerase III subunit delta'